MLVPHDNERVRSFQVTGSRVRTVVATVLLVTVLLGTFSIAFFVKQAEHIQANTLRKENELLAAEVTGMREQMEELNRSIVTLSEKDEKFRTVHLNEEGTERLEAALAEAVAVAVFPPGLPEQFHENPRPLRSTCPPRKHDLARQEPPRAG